MLPKIYQNFLEQGIFTISEVTALIWDRQQASNQVNILKKRGYFLKIKPGLYAVVPHERIGKSYTPDKFLIATRLAKPYVVSYHAALELHGIGHSLYHSVHVASPKKFRRFTFQGITYVWVSSRDLFGLTSVIRAGHPIQVTDLEKTIVDCVQKPAYAGGVGELFKSLEGVPYINYRRLLGYLEKIGQKALLAKVGYLLETFQERWGIPAAVIHDLASRVSAIKYYFPQRLRRGEGKLLSRWNLVVPRAMDRLLGIDVRDV